MLDKRMTIKGSLVALLGFMLIFGFISIAAADTPGWAPTDEQVPNWNLRWEADLLDNVTGSSFLNISLPSFIDFTLWGQIWTQNDTVATDNLTAVAFTVTTDLGIQIWDIHIPGFLLPLVQMLFPDFNGGSVWNLAELAIGLAVDLLNSITTGGTWSVVTGGAVVPGLDHVIGIELSSAQLNGTFVVGTVESYIILGVSLNITEYESGPYSLEELKDLPLDTVVNTLIMPYLQKVNLTELFGALTGFDMFGGGFGGFPFSNPPVSSGSVVLSAKATGDDHADANKVAELQGLMGQALGAAEILDLLILGTVLGASCLVVLIAAVLAIKERD